MVSSKRVCLKCLKRGTCVSDLCGPCWREYAHWLMERDGGVAAELFLDFLLPPGKDGGR